MKNSYLFLTLFFLNLSFSQTYIDVENAPFNPIAIKYKTAHFGLNNDVSISYGLMTLLQFNKKGFLTKMISTTNKFVQEFDYDDNNNLIQIKTLATGFNSDFANETIQFVETKNGLITKLYNDDPLTFDNKIFEYDTNGLLVLEKTLDDIMIASYKYNKQNKLIEKIFYLEGETQITAISYNEKSLPVEFSINKKYYYDEKLDFENNSKGFLKYGYECSNEELNFIKTDQKVNVIFLNKNNSFGYLYHDGTKTGVEFPKNRFIKNTYKFISNEQIFEE